MIAPMGEELSTMGPARREERRVTYQLGAVAAVAGSLLAMVGNLLHPAVPGGPPTAVATAIAASESWVATHMVIVAGLI
jgi:hypothetical protein